MNMEWCLENIHDSYSSIGHFPLLFTLISLFLIALQNVHRQLQDTIDDQELLKGQVSEYASQVARIEDLLAQKVGVKNAFVTPLIKS